MPQLDPGPDCQGAGAFRRGAGQGRGRSLHDLAPTMKQWRTEGLTLDGIAGRLNAEGHTTRRGRPWNPVQVARVLERAAAACV
jgi:hypothetical protein